MLGRCHSKFEQAAGLDFLPTYTAQTAERPAIDEGAPHQACRIVPELKCRLLIPHLCRLLNGEEPLMKVRLTKLADGDILAVTLSHVITGAVCGALDAGCFDSAHS